MSGAGGVEVGRVSIRVVPDTDRFKRDAEKGIKGLRSVKLPVEPELEHESLKREAKHAADKAEQEVKFEPDLDKSSLAHQARLASVIASRFKVRFRAVLDGKLATVQAAALADRLQRIANGSDLKFDQDSLSLRSLMDVAGLTAGLDKAIGRVKTMRDQFRELSRFANHAKSAVILNKYAGTSVGAMRLRNSLGILREGIVDISKDMVNSIKPWEAFKHSAKGFVSLGNAFGATAGIAAAGMGAFSAVTIALSYVIGGVVDSVKVLSRSLLMLPGLAGMAGSAFAAVTMGFRGFGEAVSAALDPSADLDEAVTGLAPNARAAAVALRGFAQPLEDLKERVQDITFEDWADQIQEVGQRFMPVLEKGMTRIAGETNKIGREFLGWAGTTQALTAMDKVFESTAKTMDSLSKATKPFLAGISELAVAGAEAIDDLAKGVPNLAERLENWATSPEGKKEMRDWIDGSIQGFKDLWSGASSLAGAMTEVGRAFGVSFNGDALERFDKTMQKFQDWLGVADDADSRIARFAESAKNLAQPWLDAATRIKDALQPAFDELLPFLESLSGEMADNIASTFERMSPVVEKFFGFLNKHSNVFVPLIAGLMGLRVGFGIFNALRKFATPFISMFTGTVGLFRKGKNLFKGAGKEAGKGARSWKFWGKSAKGAGEAVETAGKKAGKSAGKFGKVFKTAGRGAKFLGKGAFKLGTRLLPGVGTMLMLADGASLLYRNFEPFRNLVDNTKDKVVEFGKDAGTKIKDGWGKAKESFSNFDDRVKEGVETAKKRWNDIPENASRSFQRAGDRVKKKFAPISDFFKRKHGEALAYMEKQGEGRTTVTAGGGMPKIEDIKKRASEIKTAVTEAFSNIGETTSRAWEGVSSWWNETWDGIKDGVSTRWDSIKESASEKFNSAKEKANTAWEGVQDTWTSTWSSIQSTVGPIWEDLKTKASESWDGLKEKASTTWDNVQTGWVGMWEETSTTLGNAWTGIKDSASTTWANASESVRSAWDGVSEGWTGLWDGVSSSLSGTWDTIKTNASTAFDGAKQSVSSAWDTVQSETSSAWSGVVDAISSASSGATDTVSSMASSVKDNVSSAWNTVRDNTTTAMSDFVSSVTSGFDEAVSLATTLPGRFQGALGNLGGLLVSSGRSLVQGFISGIRSMIGAVASAASSVVSAARAYFPFSPAKKGPFSGKGYTTHSGKALVRDFSAGMVSEAKTAENAARRVTSSVNDQFKRHHRNKILQPVLESNAKKIADARKKERDLEKDHIEKLGKIGKEDATPKSAKDSAKQAEKNAKKKVKADEKYAEKVKKIREDLDKSLEAPDYSNIDLSFRQYYIEGAKEILTEQLKTIAQSQQLAGGIRSNALKLVKQVRGAVGNHPVLDQIELNVNSKHFKHSIYQAIEDAGIAAVPVEFVVSNLDQLKDDIGMGDGLISRAIDVALDWNANDTDAKRYRDNEAKTEIHYHVEDMNEAIRREKLRERKQLMKLG